MTGYSSLKCLAAFIFASNSSVALAQASWNVSPLDHRGEALEDVELKIEGSSQARLEARGDSWRVTLEDPEAMFVPVTLDLEGARGSYAPLTINLLARSRPSESTCSYRDIYPASVASDQSGAAYISNLFKTYRRFDGDVAKSSITYQRLTAIVGDRLDVLESGQRPIVAADIRALYNFLQVTRDLGKSNCLKPNRTAERAARFLRGLVASDIRLINGALTGNRNHDKSADVTSLVEEIALLDAYQFQALWRDVKARGVKLSTCPNFVTLRTAYTNHFTTSQIIKMENSPPHRLLNYIEDALENCVNREAEKVISDQGYLDADNWERIRSTYKPTEVSGVGNVTAGAIRSHQEAMDRWAALVTEPPVTSGSTEVRPSF